MPRYRQRLAFVPLSQGRPEWVDDPHLNLRYHVRSTALPAPGSEEQLKELAGRVFSQQLDRDKPLWEIWLVDGLEGNRFAVLSKTHHALVDGISGVDIMSVLFDTSPQPATPTDTGDRWLPRPLPSAAQLLGEAIVERATIPGEIDALGARRVPRAADGGREPARRRGGHRRDGVGRPQPGAVQPVQPVDRPAPPLHVGAREPRATSRRSRTSSAGPSTTWCSPPSPARSASTSRRRGQNTNGLELKAMVPVSVRADVERGALGNRVAAMMAPLPVWCEDPVARLDIVREELKGLKSGGQAVGAQVLTQMSGFAPTTIMEQASRLSAAPALLQPRRHERAGPADPALPPRQAPDRRVPDGPARQEPGGSASRSSPTPGTSTSGSWATTT